MAHLSATSYLAGDHRDFRIEIFSPLARSLAVELSFPDAAGRKPSSIRKHACVRACAQIDFAPVNYVRCLS